MAEKRTKQTQVSPPAKSFETIWEAMAADGLEYNPALVWRIVQQPNGLLARFDGVTFSHINLTCEQAETLCREQFGLADAKGKVERGVASGVAGFSETLAVVRMTLGEGHADELRREMSRELKNDD